MDGYISILYHSYPRPCEVLHWKASIFFFYHTSLATSSTLHMTTNMLPPPPPPSKPTLRFWTSWYFASRGMPQELDRHLSALRRESIKKHLERNQQAGTAGKFRFRGIFLCTGVLVQCVLFHVEWCTRLTALLFFNPISQHH